MTRLVPRGTIRTHRWISLGLLLSIVLISAGGCGARKLRDRQLEEVARDWSLVIRASQVIPIYPLTEDLQPGDVLLVTTPIKDQVKTYKDRGFLPLDQHFVRIPLEGSAEFYDDRYGVKVGERPPKGWQATCPDGKLCWSLAPRAAFPSYSFDVTAKTGMNLALPLQGVNLALGFMNTGTASGSVSIADAYSYGLDIVSMEKLVRDWARAHPVKLASYAPLDGSLHYLRVINRVYLTGRVNVTMTNTSDTAASAGTGGGAEQRQAAGGAGAPAGGAPASGVASGTEARESLQKAAKAVVPSGDVKISTASKRSVSLSETFPRPLVIGYIGFDMPILEGGRLGAPISTLGRLTEARAARTGAVGTRYQWAALAHLRRALDDLPEERTKGLRIRLDDLERILPPTYPFTAYETAESGCLIATDGRTEGSPIAGSGFESVVDYGADAGRTIDLLSRHLKQGEFPCPQGTQPNDELLEANLQKAGAALESFSAVTGQSEEIRLMTEVVLFTSK